VGLFVACLASLLTFSFVLLCLFVYFLALLLFYEIWVVEKWFVVSRTRQLTGSLVVAVLVVWFSCAIVLVSSPLKLAAVLAQAEYLPGSVVGGIKWQPGVSDLRLFVENPSDEDYESVDLMFEFGLPLIVGISYPGALNGVELIGDVTAEQIDGGGVSMRRPELTIESQGQKVSVPTIQLATSQYRCRMVRLPKKSAAEVVIAVAQIDQKRTQNIASIMPMSKPEEPSGHGVLIGPQGQPVFYKKARPHQVIVRGTYIASYRKRSIDERLSVR